ncbi:MAG: hypothetical protein [Caudoviricetes sp.]|nr:MAG: hypothetical protein [Caudoviricetes sp.]
MANKSSVADKAQFARYKTDNQYAKNKVRKLISHLAKFPNDEIAKAALKNASTAVSPRWKYKRSTSTLNSVKRVTDGILSRKLRLDRMYKTAKDGIVLKGVLFSAQAVKDAFSK